MVVAIVLGALAGVAGFLPLIGAQRIARKATPTSNFGFLGALLLGVLVSFLVVAVAVVVCIAVARDAALPFVLAEFFALIGSAVAFNVYKLVRK